VSIGFLRAANPQSPTACGARVRTAEMLDLNQFRRAAFIGQLLTHVNAPRTPDA